MKPDRIDRLLKGLPSDLPIPRDLSARILIAVEKRASALEKRQAFWAAVQLSLGITAVIYGFTAAILTLLNSNLGSYWSLVQQDPSILTTSDGFRALWEQLPVLPLLIFFGGLVYSVRHLMIRGVKARKLSSVMAGLFVVVAAGSFVGGIAVGATNSGQITADASSILFTPVVTPSSDYQYSSSGQVTHVETAEDGTSEVTILLPNGKEKTVEVPQSVLDKNSNRVIQEGDKIFILGKPGGFKGKPGNFKANFIQLSQGLGVE